jgi:hypothetical protein
MRSFFKYLFTFSLVLCLFLWLATIISNQIYQLSLPKNSEISVLVLGDSHAQSGINIDSKVNNSLNLAASAESFYFCHQKLQYFIAKKVKVESVILAVGPHSLSKSLDSKWLFDELNFIEKMRSYWPLINFSSIGEYITNAHFSRSVYFELIPELLYQNFYTIERFVLLGKSPFIGGYTESENNNKIKLVPEVSDSINKKLTLEGAAISELQLFYLNKIVQLCNENSVKLILLNTPLFNGTKLENLQNVKGDYEVFDYGDLFKNDTRLFADFVHLNGNGAELFSDTLVNKLTIK